MPTDIPSHSNIDVGEAGIAIQIEHMPPGGAVDPQAVQDVIKRFSTEQLQAIGDFASQVYTQVLARMHEMNPRPSGISLEFGIGVSGQMSVFVAKGAIETNFKIVLEWK